MPKAIRRLLLCLHIFPGAQLRHRISLTIGNLFIVLSCWCSAQKRADPYWMPVSFRLFVDTNLPKTQLECPREYDVLDQVQEASTAGCMQSHYVKAFTN